MAHSSPDQRTALVTGGARRVGAAIVRRLAREGYRVLIHADRAIDDAKALAASLKEAGQEADIIAGNLADPTMRATLMSQAAERYGPIALLVNNASIFGSDRLATFSDEDFFNAMTVNCLAPITLARAFAEQAPRDHDPSIVNLVDHRVMKLTPQHFTYTLSKAALATATVTMAQALAPFIRVNSIGPGPTLPNSHDGQRGLDHEAAGVLLKHSVDPDALAEAVAYLARARSVTGQMIAVDAGQHLGWQTPDIIPD
jgi:NAD(P)-dependent dehydrogenase (short-subunit alcohol dehydrogenase family)